MTVDLEERIRAAAEKAALTQITTYYLRRDRTGSVLGWFRPAQERGRPVWIEVKKFPPV